MSTTPDLDPSNIGYIAYWNVYDDGAVSSFNIDEALTANNIVSKTLYDNGVQGKLETNGNREANFKIKTDGWFIVWFDGSKNTGQNGSYTNLRGRWDISDVWWRRKNHGDLIKNALAKEIKQLQSNLSITTTFNFGDVSLYNYAHEEATNATLLCAWGETYSYNDGTTTAGFVPSQSTSLVAVDQIFTVHKEGDHVWGDSWGEFNGNELMRTSGAGVYFTADVTGMTNVGENNIVKIHPYDRGEYSDYTSMNFVTHFLWS